jgi:hypothetical protein
MNSAVVINHKQEFLEALDHGTRDVYSNGLNKCESFLRAFPEYATVEEPLYEFLRRVKADRNIEDPLNMTFIERKTVKGLFQKFKEQGFSAKSQLAFVAALQAFGQFYQVPISTKYADPPASVAINERYEWTLDQLGKYIESMKSIKYQSLSTTLLQCTLRPCDVLGKNLPYGLIKDEFESGIVPVCIPIKSSEKTLIRHRTFLGSLAVQKLQLHFKEFGTPKIDEPIYPVSLRSTEEYFERHAKKQFPPWTGQNPYSPYSIRGAACTFLQDALCPETVIEYFSGHNLDGDVALRYRRRSTDKWREFYKRFEWGLDYTVKLEDRPKTSIAELKQFIESLSHENGEAS